MIMMFGNNIRVLWRKTMIMMFGNNIRVLWRKTMVMMFINNIRVLLLRKRAGSNRSKFIIPKDYKYSKILNKFNYKSYFFVVSMLLMYIWAT